ncbi:choice-of-anchor M domain-containing protein [Corynebacterium sp. ES2794-CONJ1]|uniref:choice-of-anchor M domain-containing protein n=1 Tax=unclassified Corynebacterium TaxID=2624378 RepID=UPI0021685EA6|nr:MULTISPECIES: choice-of-anchor M domain-containing protein [unclassified Corynebacterium]MCS4489968.1 choice-of-anchor M domain-containing protein [Corynebacterium sp. ES2775-CONJ]MCS4491669.1 choice-of-anchor M domain-containing protein [Corynebacterium sp. ES2715-CONJ3]MCS4531774.1 choice-of-anchor M domain-containing protein [Corynebacterium sp. ES2730-CONJ]MCU9519170.1 choice-of-anchor M domain-containing protein [Corynebacterium sp. ES2794-CONJ1]
MRKYALALSVSLAFMPLGMATVAFPPAVVAAEESSGIQRYLVRENHQDMHLFLGEDQRINFLMRDDGSFDSRGLSPMRESETVFILVGDDARLTSARLEPDLGPDRAGITPNGEDEIWNLPEVQITTCGTHVPWVGFSTLGITSEQLGGATSLPLSMDLLESPEDGRVVFWKQQNSLFSQADVLLDSADASKVWDFPAHAHVHSGIIFTQPGIYTTKFAFGGNFAHNPVIASDYTVNFVVGEETIDDLITAQDYQFIEQQVYQPQNDANCGPRQSRTASSIGQLPRVLVREFKKLDSEVVKLGKSLDNLEPRQKSTESESPQSLQAPESLQAPAETFVPVQPRSASSQLPVIVRRQTTPIQQSPFSPALSAPPVASSPPPSVPNASLQPVPAQAQVEATNARENSRMGEGVALGIGMMSLIMGFAAFGVARFIN